MKRSKRSTSLADLQYNGPIRLPAGRNQASVVKANLTSTIELQSNGSGVIADTRIPRYCQDDPDWATYSTLYGQVRCLGMEVEYHPYFNETPTTTLNQRSLVYAVQHISDEADLLSLGAASYADMVSLPTHKIGSTGRTLSISARARGTREMEFVDVEQFNTPNGWPSMAVYQFADGLSASTTYGRCIIRYLLEFKGRI